MFSKQMLKRALMTNKEIGDKEEIKKIRLYALMNAESLFELAIARTMAKYGTY